MDAHGFLATDRVHAAANRLPDALHRRLRTGDVVHARRLRRQVNTKRTWTRRILVEPQGSVLTFKKFTEFTCERVNYRGSFHAFTISHPSLKCQFLYFKICLLFYPFDSNVQKPFHILNCAESNPSAPTVSDNRQGAAAVRGLRRHQDHSRDHRRSAAQERKQGNVADGSDRSRRPPARTRSSAFD